MRYLLIIILFPFAANSQTIVADTLYYVNPSGGWFKTVIYRNQSTTTSLLKADTANVLATATKLAFKTDSLATALATFTQSRINDTAAAIRTTVNSKAPLASPAFTGTPTGIGIPVYARVTGSNATTTGQALVDITGLSVALATNAVYEFDAVLSVSTTAVTTGTAYGVNYSAAGATVEAQIIGAATSTATKTLRINSLNTATALYLATSAQTGGVVIKGTITTGANAGNFTIKHLKLTSGTSTIFINSFLKVTRIN